MPIAWTAVEWIRTYVPVGFPWNLLGYTAYRNLELIQFAEFTGVYGVSALIVFFNAVVYVVIFRRGAYRLQTISLSALTAIMIALVGVWRVADRQSRGRAAQRAVSRSRWCREISRNRSSGIRSSCRRVTEFTRTKPPSAAKRGADLIVWPEAAAAFLFQPDDQYPAELAGDAAYRTALLTLARNHGRADIVRRTGAGARRTAAWDFTIARTWCRPTARAKWMRTTTRSSWCRSASTFRLARSSATSSTGSSNGFGDLVPGKQQTLFDFKGAKLGILICYESIFPDFTRREVNEGADVLVNITNDAWYGESSAPYQVLAMAAMRSVETKVPMVRVANTGISALIEPSGQITNRTPLFKRGTEIVDVSWRPVRTVYTIVGDLFAEICFALTAIGLILAWRWPRPATLEVKRRSNRARVPANGRPH